MENNNKTLFEKIEIPSELDNKVRIGIERAEKELNQNHASISWISVPQKRILYAVSAVILLFGLFIGSAFVSPVMADVASNIPYLGRIFESKDIGQVVSEELKDEGYNVGSISVSYNRKPTISIPLNESEEYINQVKGKVEKIVKDTLYARDYDRFEIKIYSNRNVKRNVSNSSLEISSKTSSLIMDIHKKVEEHGLEFLTLGVRPNEKFVQVDIPSNEERTDELEKIILDVAKGYGMQDYTVKFRKVDLKKQAKSQEWKQIILVLAEELIGNSKYKVDGISYSDSKEPFTLIITSSLNSSNPEAKNSAKELENMINDLINSDVVNEKIKGEPYDILIKSKDGKKIN
ncbi:DUF4030 domain-containing protein [Bacillus cereus]|uniref:DUF4179 domain-containing protein n=1 Tax=Bacillus cereus TaxID=1396 RepID=A0AA44TCR5_BACCE|nr:DUF4030 domain-containing protein [Bacillus cereus]PFN04607.1 hypothetical protein COJ55_20910 [Bacillus cereus]PFR89841.1 hypothetical protein COK38_23900 [Bacillus cereus]